MKTLKTLVIGGLLSIAAAAPLLTPSPAEAWWHGGGWGWRGGWGWHAGWHPGYGYGWHGGVVVGGPAVAVGYPYGYGYPYAWVPGYYAPGGVFVGGHWGWRR